MDRNSVDWRGPMPAITTPFDHAGRIDEAALGANIERLLANGATGFLVGGCTGEFWALSNQERVRLCEAAVAIVAGRVPLLMATGAVTVDETVAMTREAERIGADGAVILPPYFVKLTHDEIAAHFESVAAATGLPIMLYNIPGNAVNALTPELVLRLASIDRVVAVKESSGDWGNFYRTLIAAGESIRVFCGPSSLFGVPAIELGADGTIDCFPNVWSPGGLDLFFAAERGDRDEARRLQAMGQRLTDLFTSEGRTLYPATKAAMDMMGLKGGGVPRPPLRPLDAAQRAGLEAGLKTLGLI